MKTERPVNLNLFAFHFPITAISSIIHRISGVVLALAIPFALYALHLSLRSLQDFQNVKECLTSGLGSFAVWVVLSALIYHLVAGIRHLLMDMGLGESLCAARCGAKIVLALSFILIVMLGVVLW